MTDQHEKKNVILSASDFCPRCGNREGVPLIFGYRSDKMMEREANGEIFFGGISVGPGPWPNRQCRQCNYGWVSLDDDRPMPFDIADLNVRMPEAERDFYAVQWFSNKAEQAYRAIADINDSGYWFTSSEEMNRINFFLDDCGLSDILEDLLKILDESGATRR